MIGLVRLALRRPYTSAIAAILILLLGSLSITRMVVDTFPVIDIPVVLVVWNYNGLTTEDMERRVVFISERAYSTTVSGISRIESQSIPSVGLLRFHCQPGTDIGSAIAQIGSVNNTILRIAPPGMPPPAVIQFNASNVPVVQLTMSSKTLTEQQIYDYSLNFIRVKLFTIPGLSTPGPFGGKSRQIKVDIDPARLEAKGFSPTNVPGGFAYATLHVPITSSPEFPVAALTTRGTNTFVADVGKDNQVHLKPVKVANADGTVASLMDSARVGDRVALNLPDEVSDGGRIRPVESSR